MSFRKKLLVVASTISLIVITYLAITIEEAMFLSTKDASYKIHTRLLILDQPLITINQEKYDTSLSRYLNKNMNEDVREKWVFTRNEHRDVFGNVKVPYSKATASEDPNIIFLGLSSDEVNKYFILNNKKDPDFLDKFKIYLGDLKSDQSNTFFQSIYTPPTSANRSGRAF